MHKLLLLLPLALTGCGLFTNLVGDWEGTCEFSNYDMDVELQLDEDDRGDLAGEVTVNFEYYGYDFELDGDVEGTRDGSEVDLELDFGDDGKMDIVGELTDKDTIEGECQSGGSDGDIELER